MKEKYLSVNERTDGTESLQTEHIWRDTLKTGILSADAMGV